MLVADELLNRTKNCCLTPTDFLEALVRLADVILGTTTITTTGTTNSGQDETDPSVNPDEIFEVHRGVVSNG